MTYMESMGNALSSLIKAGEAGRTSIEGMMGPVNGAISEITGAAAELEGLPFVSPEMGAKIQRTMRAINTAQSAVGRVVSKYSTGVTKAREVGQRLGVFKEQAGKAAAVVNRIAGQVSPALGNILPTGALAPGVTPAAEAVKPFPHLLILQPLEPNAKPYYFNVDTAAFDELRRQTGFRWAGQERLTRDIAQQAVGQGEDKLTIKGVIFPAFKGGIGQLDTLRGIGRKLGPVSLVTGFGAVLGTWCLTNVEEEQSALLAGGIPRKQSFSLEFVKYGNDLQNV